MQSPISIEDEDVAGKALLRLHESKCAKIFTLPGVVHHFNARSVMEDAILDLDKLVSSMVFRTDAHECHASELQASNANCVNTLVALRRERPSH